MNRTLLPVFVLSTLALAAGCSASPSPSPADIGVAQSSLTRDTAPNVASSDLSELVKGNTEFAMDAYQVLAKQPGNLFYSPFSMSSALAMTYAGAGGDTATEMAKAMHYSLSADKLHPAFDALDLQLASRASASVGKDDKPLSLHVANGLFGQKTDSFGTPYLDTLMKSYGAGVKLVDFIGSPDPSRVAINGWIASQTNDKITDMLPPNTITPDTRFVLVDAIYFDASWQSRFQKNATADGSFTKQDGGKVTAHMMHNDETHASFTHDDAFDAVELPYAGGQVAMDIIAPKAGTFGAFESGLTSEKLSTILSGMKSGIVDLTMPKFEIKGSTVSVKDMLTGFGMKKAFTPAADFTAIDTTSKVFIGDVLHKAFVSVDEDGTEAAAATAVIGVGTAAPTSVTKISVDRPFVFVIRDLPTGAVLFAGRISDPSAN